MEAAEMLNNILIINSIRSVSRVHGFQARDSTKYGDIATAKLVDQLTSEKMMCNLARASGGEMMCSASCSKETAITVFDDVGLGLQVMARITGIADRILELPRRHELFARGVVDLWTNAWP